MPMHAEYPIIGNTVIDRQVPACSRISIYQCSLLPTRKSGSVIETITTSEKEHIFGKLTQL